MNPLDVAIIGAGPAGLMAADILSARGLAVTVFDRMPSPGRKFLMAGRGGLNLTHSVDFESFLSRYDAAAPRLRPILAAFGPKALISWSEGLGQGTFVGSSGRVFPKAMKASPLLRALLARLAAQGTQLRTRHEWRGWDEDGCLLFRAGGKDIRVEARATILALGGASWPRLGSNGAWTEILQRRGIAVTPLAPANCGLVIDWSTPFRAAFAGHPLKGIALTFACRHRAGRGSRDRLWHRRRRHLWAERQVARRNRRQGKRYVRHRFASRSYPSPRDGKAEPAAHGQSVSNILRKALHLPPIAINLCVKPMVFICRTRRTRWRVASSPCR